MGVGWGSDDDADEHALQEADRGERQSRHLSRVIRAGISDPRAFRLTTALLCELNELAMRDILPTAGKLRVRSDQMILGSRHILPPHEQVPGLLEEACDYVNGRPDAEPLFVAAYVLWRVCWIHPFDDGNGRTARAASYLTLSVRLGMELPGEVPIPLRTKHAPIAYWRALEAADAAWAKGELDVSNMEKLLAFYLAAQLRGDPHSLPP